MSVLVSFLRFLELNCLHRFLSLRLLAHFLNDSGALSQPRGHLAQPERQSVTWLFRSQFAVVSCDNQTTYVDQIVNFMHYVIRGLSSLFFCTQSKVHL